MLKELQFVEDPVLCIYIRCRRRLCSTDVLEIRVLYNFFDVPYSVSIIFLVWSLN
jgi:hypothetical protein